MQSTKTNTFLQGYNAFKLNDRNETTKTTCSTTDFIFSFTSYFLLVR
jgi:hypothetical protein